MVAAQADRAPTASVTQGLLANLVKTLHTMSFEAGHAWLQRMVRRQHLWHDEVLVAAWATVHLDEVRDGKPITPPDGLDLARVSWLLKQGAETRDYVLRQRGPRLYIEPEAMPRTATGLEVPGSPLSPVRATSRYVQVQVIGADGRPESASWQSLEQGIDLPAEGSLRLCTDHQELTLDGIVRPAWAEGIWCDAHGLWVTWAQGQQRAYWVPSGPYPVYDRAGARIDVLSLTVGHWHEATAALAHLRAGWQQPSWATTYGVDGYGLYASVSVNGAEQRLRWMAPGEFTMGSPQDEPECLNDERQHQVLLTRGFWLSETACTQALWQAVMGENPSHFRGKERPVEGVSWEDVQHFLTRIHEDTPDLGLRLPTEAEWEYACRAGTTTAFWFGRQITPEQVNYDGNYPYAGVKRGLYRQETVPVKALPCNGWGLYQMHGNVWEWCQDWYGEYPAEAVVDPTGPAQGALRVLRGGGWIIDGGRTRSARRGAGAPRYRYHDLGFRLARGQVPSR